MLTILDSFSSKSNFTDIIVVWKHPPTHFHGNCDVCVGTQKNVWYIGLKLYALIYCGLLAASWCVKFCTKGTEFDLFIFKKWINFCSHEAKAGWTQKRESWCKPQPYYFFTYFLFFSDCIHNFLHNQTRAHTHNFHP